MMLESILANGLLDEFFCHTYRLEISREDKDKCFPLSLTDENTLPILFPILGDSQTSLQPSKEPADEEIVDYFATVEISSISFFKASCLFTVEINFILGLF